MMINLTDEHVAAAQAEENRLLTQAMVEAKVDHLFTRVVTLSALLMAFNESVEAGEVPDPEPGEGSHRLE